MFEKPKFILTEDAIKLGHVVLHLDLKGKKDKVLGGGYWHIDKERKHLFLYGKSQDFGSLTLEQLVRAKNISFIQPSIENLIWVYSPSDNLEIALKSPLKF